MEQTEWGRPTRAVIDLEAIRTNVRNTKDRIGPETELIAVVKADGYGHGAVRVAEAALGAGASMLAVATPEEAVELREAGLEADILLLGAAPLPFVEVAAAHHITVTADSARWMRSAALRSKNLDVPLKVHLKLDTGMGRIGMRTEEELLGAWEAARAADIVIDGAFTHFAKADDEDCGVQRLQEDRFRELIGTLPEKPRLVHASNSAATYLHPGSRFDAVRLGISMYGIPASDHAARNMPFTLQPALTLESRLVHVKKIRKGDTVSYGATYEAADDEWIGTLPIGYADGLLRGLGGQDVLVGGSRVPIVGRICMDQCMIRLPGEMEPGEPVVLIGRQGDEEVTADEWARRLGTIPYEVVVTLSKRIPRVYRRVDWEG
ncbi:alanine racemase [Bhargavaea ullalensis]|uniref:Alanine racemase n=1 Tax=Bhargavaea ullalensis TaxID=1265685 RepID=A0ABV2GDC1_9BACL